MSRPDSAAPSAAINPWRGERHLTLGDAAFTLTATPDTIARLFEALKVDRLDALITRMDGRNPSDLRAALAVFIGGDEADAAMTAAPGLAGYATIYAAIGGAISGMTPDEEAALKKAEAARADAMRQAAVLALAKAAKANSDASPSLNG